MNCTVPLSLSQCFTSVESEIAGSADAPRWRRRWQHHASVFSPSIHLSVPSDITPSLHSGIHPSSARGTSTMKRRRRRRNRERCSERKRSEKRWREVENESVGLSSCVQQQQQRRQRRLSDTENTFRQRESRGGRGRQQGQLLLPVTNHSPVS